VKEKNYTNKTELRKLLNAILPIVEKAGRKLNRQQQKLHQLKITKKEAQGLVSNADVESENFLIKKLKPLISNAEFLAEESAFKKYGNKKDAYLSFKKVPYSWIIDPLDGTSNFLSKMDYYCICVCLAHYGDPVLGIIHRPSSGETFYGIKGLGAKLIQKDGRKKKVSVLKQSRDLKNYLMVTGFACEKGEVFDQEFSVFKSVMEESRGVRRLGSAALDMTMLAQGVFGGFWERGLAPWDVAAASVIVKEAGGKITDYNGQRFNPFQDTIVASNGVIHEKLRQLLNP